MTRLNAKHVSGDRMSSRDFFDKSVKGLSESTIQKSLIEKLKYYKFQGDYLSNLVYAVPNGGHRTKRQAATLKKEGVLSGIPDLHCIVAAQGYHSLYIEMKTEIGSLSDNQKKVIARLRKHGHKVVICRSVEDALEEIFKYLGMVK